MSSFILNPFLLLITLTSGQQNSLEFMYYDYDMGIIDESNPLEIIFPFKNVGGTGIEIKKVQTDCGCTVANVTEGVINPGSEGVIEVAFTPEGIPGDKEYRVEVHTTDTYHPLIMLVIRCQYAPKIYLSAQEILLTNLRDDKASEDSWDITATALEQRSRIKIDHVDMSNALGFRTEILPTEYSTSSIIRFSNTGPLPAGRYSGTALIHCSSPSSLTLEVTLSGWVVGKLEVTPPFIAMDREVETWRTGVRISPGYVSDFKILDIRPSNGISSEIVPSGNGYLIVFSGSEMDCSMNDDSIVVQTDVSGLETITLPIRVRNCEEP